MNTRFFVRSKSIHDNTYSEISLQKICETFGLHPSAFQLVAQTDDGTDEIIIEPLKEYGFAGYFKSLDDGEVSLVEIEFSEPDNEDITKERYIFTSGPSIHLRRIERKREKYRKLSAKKK